MKPKVEKMIEMRQTEKERKNIKNKLDQFYKGNPKFISGRKV